MKIPLSWIRDYVDTTANVRDIVEKLTIAGLEVSNVSIIGENWDCIAVAELVDIQPHPNADKLRLATVNLGNRQVTVVCGAPNLNIGDKVAFAEAGARLVDGHSGQLVQLKPAKIRGILSEGMICSERELGISENHEGIMVLPIDATTGIPLSDYIGDTILDIDITPNRPDCLSIIGIAREIAALTRGIFHLPVTTYEQRGKSIQELASVQIADSDLCPRYCASLLTNVKIGPSPVWMQRRLTAAGMRPINNVVDITNYVALEYGQPLHAFDFQKLKGYQIIVRRALPAEEITTLDGNKHILNPNMLVIADAERAIAVAGIMGGSDTEVTHSTNDILLESANFNRVTIHNGSISLKLSSEASLRFEKGLSMELAMVALKRATQLMVELTGATAAKDIIDIYPGKKHEKTILLHPNEVKRLLGIELTGEDIVEYLELFRFKTGFVTQSNELEIEIPWWRTDITCKADIVEEIARIYGYENIPTTMLSSSLPSFESESFLLLRQKIRDIMISCGFQEIMTYSLTNLELMEKSFLNAQSKEMLKVANPMSHELEYLRTSLIPGVLSTITYNQRYQRRGFKLFELGKVFLGQGNDLPNEREMLCVMLGGPQAALFWKEKDEPVDFFVAKGIAETIFSGIDISVDYLSEENQILLSGNAASISVKGEKLGLIGELHPKILKTFDIVDAAYLIELDIKKIFQYISSLYKYKPISKFPSVIRDLALVIDETVTYQKVKEILESFPLLFKVSLFDFYKGEQIPEGKKSLAFRLVYQSDTHTLSDQEVDRVQEQMLARLGKEVGAALRV